MDDLHEVRLGIHHTIDKHWSLLELHCQKLNFTTNCTVWKPKWQSKEIFAGLSKRNLLMCIDIGFHINEWLLKTLQSFLFDWNYHHFCPLTRSLNTNNLLSFPALLPSKLLNVFVILYLLFITLDNIQIQNKFKYNLLVCNNFFFFTYVQAGYGTFLKKEVSFLTDFK